MSKKNIKDFIDSLNMNDLSDRVNYEKDKIVVEVPVEFLTNEYKMNNMDRNVDKLSSFFHENNIVNHDKLTFDESGSVKLEFEGNSAEMGEAYNVFEKPNFDNLKELGTSVGQEVKKNDDVVEKKPVDKSAFFKEFKTELKNSKGISKIDGVWTYALNDKIKSEIPDMDSKSSGVEYRTSVKGIEENISRIDDYLNEKHIEFDSLEFKLDGTATLEIDNKFMNIDFVNPEGLVLNEEVAQLGNIISDLGDSLKIEPKDFFDAISKMDLEGFKETENYEKFELNDDKNEINYKTTDGVEGSIKIDGDGLLTITSKEFDSNEEKIEKTNAKSLSEFLDKFQEPSKKININPTPTREEISVHDFHIEKTDFTDEKSNKNALIFNQERYEFQTAIVYEKDGEKYIKFEKKDSYQAFDDDIYKDLSNTLYKSQDLGLRSLTRDIFSEIGIRNFEKDLSGVNNRDLKNILSENEMAYEKNPYERINVLQNVLNGINETDIMRDCSCRDCKTEDEIRKQLDQYDQNKASRFEKNDLHSLRNVFEIKSAYSGAKKPILLQLKTMNASDPFSKKVWSITSIYTPTGMLNFALRSIIGYKVNCYNPIEGKFENIRVRLNPNEYRQLYPLLYLRTNYRRFGDLRRDFLAAKGTELHLSRYLDGKIEKKDFERCLEKETELRDLADSYQDKISNLNDEIKSLDKDIDRLRDDISNADKKLDNLKNDKEKNNEKINDLKEKNKELLEKNKTEKNADKKAENTEKIKANEKKIDNLEKKNKDIDKKTEKLDKNKLEKKLEGLEKKKEGLQNKLEKKLDKLSGLDKLSKDFWKDPKEFGVETFKDNVDAERDAFEKDNDTDDSTERNADDTERNDESEDADDNVNDKKDDPKDGGDEKEPVDKEQEPLDNDFSVENPFEGDRADENIGDENNNEDVTDSNPDDLQGDIGDKKEYELGDNEPYEPFDIEDYVAGGEDDLNSYIDNDFDPKLYMDPFDDNLEGENNDSVDDSFDDDSFVDYDKINLDNDEKIGNEIESKLGKMDDENKFLNLAEAWIPNSDVSVDENKGCVKMDGVEFKVEFNDLKGERLDTTNVDVTFETPDGDTVSFNERMAYSKDEIGSLIDSFKEIGEKPSFEDKIKTFLEKTKVTNFERIKIEKINDVPVEACQDKELQELMETKLEDLKDEITGNAEDKQDNIDTFDKNDYKDDDNDD